MKEVSEIDMTQLKGTLIAALTALMTFGHAKLMYIIDVFFQPGELMEFIIKFFGFLVAVAAIWMNVETALTRRAERRKLKRNEQEAI